MSTPKLMWLEVMLASTRSAPSQKGSFASWGSISACRAARSGCWPLLGLLCLFLCLQVPASAQGPTQESWTGADGNSQWSDGDNWSPPTKPGGPNGNFNVVISVIGPPQPVMDVSATIYNLEIDSRESLNITGGNQLTVTGTTIANNGALNIDVNGGGSGGILKITNIATLSGSGLTQLASPQAFISGPGTLINQQSMVGEGTISVSSLQNQAPGGQIEGDSSAHPLMFTNSVTNSGLIATQSFGAIEFVNNTVQNGGGSIVGGEGAALLNGCTVVGGTLSGQAYALPVATTAAAVKRAAVKGSRAVTSATTATAVTGAPTLNGVTITGDYFITSDANHTAGTTLVGDITNNGSIEVTGAPGAQPAELIVPGAATVGGTGSVNLAGQNASLTGNGTLTNLSPQVIYANEGELTVNQFNNESTLSTSSYFTVQVPTFNNTNGTFSVTGGTVYLNSGAVTNGNITVVGDAILQWEDGVMLSGIDISGGGTVIVINAILDGITDPNTVAIIIEIDDNGELILEGVLDLISPGDLYLDAAEFTALLVIDGSVTVNGTGQITSSNNPNNKVGGAAGKKNALTINVPALTAGGTIGDGTFNITVSAHTTVTNNGGYPLIFDVGPNHTFKNLGTLVETSPSGIIEIVGNFSNYNNTTNTLTGGSYVLDGTLEFPNADLVTNAAKLTLSGNGQILNQNGANGLLNFSNNSSKGTFELSGGQSFETGGTFNNEGKLIVSRGSTFTVGGTSTNFNQIAGTTTVDGTLTVPAGGLTDITGGTLQASGSFNGDVSVGNATGAAATFIIGDSKKASASVSIANHYTQLATGVMDVQIGGINAGSEYSQLSVTDAVKLAGTLNLALINKFKPQIGQTFTAINAPSGITGTFPIVNGTVINSNEHFAVNFDSNSIMLTVESGK